MNETERQEILSKAKIFFREHLAQRHLQNLNKLEHLHAFNVNPFLTKYLANFAFGDDRPENIAKALLYPRILGTSIATTFGNQMQFFCNEILKSYASTTSGIDIEFIDTIDNRRKYCQIKSGPTTINHDDVTTIINHFTAIKNLARTNRNLEINPDIDCIVGVLYGEPHELSSFYRKINEAYPVFCGQDLWHRLTGAPGFYDDLIHAIAEVAVEIDAREQIQHVLSSLAEEIAENH